MPLREPVCDSCGQSLPDIESIQQKLNELHRAHPTTEMSEGAYLMTRQLHIAVHGDSWARPESTQRVWLDLLRKVAEMAGHQVPASRTAPPSS